MKAEDAVKWELTQGNTKSDKVKGKHSQVHSGISGERMSQIRHRRGSRVWSEWIAGKGRSWPAMCAEHSQTSAENK
jgi:hypothetical protein